MSKKSRGFEPEKSASDGSTGEASTGEASTATTASTDPAATTSRSSRSSRSAARRTERGKTKITTGSPLDRYRGVIVAGIAVAAIGLVGIFLIQGASAAPYTCETLLTPPPTAGDGEGPVGPVASPSGEALLGFATEDLGRGHLASGAAITYAYCPPASGDHWSDGSRSPLRRDVYSPSDTVVPGNWVHNLEHGYVVFAYQGEPEAAVMSQIREAVDAAPPGPMSEICNLPNKVMAVRFDDMSEPFAAIAWDRVMLMPEWDSEAAMAFAAQWQDSPQAPEEVC